MINWMYVNLIFILFDLLNLDLLYYSNENMLLLFYYPHIE